MEQLKRRLIEDVRYRQGIDRCLDRPQVLVAPVNACNFACDYCSTRLHKNQRVVMDLDLAKHIIDGAVNNGWSLFFGQTFEPFLHPQIEAIIAHVDRRGQVFSSATNGSLLRDSVRDLPMHLVISYSADASDYAFRRSRLPFARYQQILHDFLNYRIRARIPGSLSLQIADYTILSGDVTYERCLRDVEGIYRKTVLLAERLGLAAPWSLEDCRERITRREPLVLHRDGATIIQVQPTKIMPNSYEAFVRLPEGVEPAGYCDSCFTMMSIQADGAVALCCCDPSAKAVAGRLDLDTDLKAFWLGEAMSRVRERFRAFRPLHAFCATCLHNVSEHIKPLLTVKDPTLVAAILRDFGVESGLPWFEFPVS